MQDLLHGAHDVLERAGVGRGHEDRGEVGPVADALEHGSGDLAHGVGGERVLAHGGREGHRAPTLLPRPRAQASGTGSRARRRAR